MRIARFTTGDDPQYGVVTGDVDELGIPAEDSVVVALAGDPLYVGVQLTDTEHPARRRAAARAGDPAQQGGRDRPNYAAHAAEMGGDVPAEPLMFLKPNTSVVGPGDPVFYPRAVLGGALRGRARRGHRPDLPRRRARAGRARSSTATPSPTT